MVKIIRVSGCHDCPYCRFDGEAKGAIDCYYCYWATSTKVDSYMKKATLPDNCPLEEEVDIHYPTVDEELFGYDGAKTSMDGFPLVK